MALISAPALKKRAGFFELEDIRHLDLSCLGISSISLPPAALLQCVNLTVLSLRKNEVKTLDGIESLAALERLDLSDNKIANVAAISKLMKLECLNLVNNAITDIKQLEHLKELTSLRVLALGPGRSNAITVGDRHVQVLLEVVPTLQMLDGQFVAIIKVCVRAVLPVFNFTKIQSQCAQASKTLLSSIAAHSSKLAKLLDAAPARQQPVLLAGSTDLADPAVLTAVPPLLLEAKAAATLAARRYSFTSSKLPTP